MLPAASVPRPTVENTALIRFDLPLDGSLTTAMRSTFGTRADGTVAGTAAGSGFFAKRDVRLASVHGPAASLAS